jgi:hypothetical protein
VSDCIEWQGAQNGTGYGYRTVKRKNWLAHRYAYTVAYGDIPDGMLVRHKCDNKLCINPEHLELGNKSDNALDCIKRQGLMRGEHSGTSKLSDSFVLWLRSLQQPNFKNIANLIGLDPATLRYAYNGKTWKHLPINPLTSGDTPYLLSS